MRNIRDILREQGIELDDAQLKAIETEVLENYRTKAEVDSKAARLAELESQLKAANDAIETARKTDATNAAEVEGMRARLDEYERAEAERKAKADADASRRAFDAELADAIGERRFANDIVRGAVTAKAFDLHQANPDMSLDTVIAAVVGDADGVWENPQRDIMKMPAGASASATGTQSIQSLDQLAGMSTEDVRKHMAEVDRLLAEQG